MVPLEVAHSEVGKALGDHVDVEGSRAWLESVISRQGVVCCVTCYKSAAPASEDVMSPPYSLDSLTHFGDGLVLSAIVQRSERYRAPRDDDFLDAGGESSVQYARGPSNGRLEKVLWSTS